MRTFAGCIYSFRSRGQGQPKWTLYYVPTSCLPHSRLYPHLEPGPVCLLWDISEDLLGPQEQSPDVYTPETVAQGSQSGPWHLKEGVLPMSTLVLSA